MLTEEFTNSTWSTELVRFFLEKTILKIVLFLAQHTLNTRMEEVPAALITSELTPVPYTIRPTRYLFELPQDAGPKESLELRLQSGIS